MTIPYKEQIIPYLDELSEEAKKLAPSIVFPSKNGKTKGFNTDAFGFEKHFFHKKPHQKSAIVLEMEEQQKAVQFVLKRIIFLLLRFLELRKFNYQNLTENQVFRKLIIIQCTPVELFPNVEETLVFPFENITENHLVIDLILQPYSF